MQNIGATLTPNQPWPFQVRGTVLQIISSGNSAGLTVQFLLGSQVQHTIEDVLTGWKIKPAGGFDSITIESATGDTVSAIVTAGDVDIQILESNSQVTNTSANPVPVSLVSEPGAPVAVNVVSGTINMTATNVGIVPSGSASADVAPVAVGTSGALLIAAAAGRKRLMIRNAGAGQLALTTAAGTTFANAAVVLQPGDVWQERDAPQIAWYAVSDVGTTANLQTVS
ncbi:hypothetical protein SAMN02787142_1251 [Burkholderia sp. WP9]|uniref:hypothetical protein n=1 Tax=Burkholderia sp. WP9 TaxID=1500263 RepID=UPI00089506E8|nr:hypothetical protein [Burkholderia sp. WP9]SEC35791.1 hypothetical protein SAMN02787142_1251 [Burkholderia sp. WP9]